MPTLTAIREELYALADPADAIHLQRFFKTAPGEYGAGDKFLAFLKKHYREMPRTMLRYAIERHPEKVRKQYLAGTL